MPRHPPSNQTESARNKQQTLTHYNSKTTTTGCWQRPDKQTKPSTKYYLQKVSHNNYHILPLIDDDPNCTTKDCIPKANPPNPQRSEDVDPARTKNPQRKPDELNDNTKRGNSPKPTNIRPLSATLQLDRRNKMLYVPLQFREYENQALLDTGAIQSAMSENELRRILQAHPATQIEIYPAPDFKVQIANGNIVPVRKQVLLRFFIGGKIFEETFMILPTMGNILIGMSFFKKYSVSLDLANNIVRFPEITLQLKPPNGKFRLQMLELRMTQKTTISPGQQIFVHATTDKNIGTVTGTIETFPAFERKTELLVSSSMSEIKDQQTYIQITNHMDHKITIPQHSTVAVFRILTPNQA